MLKADPTRPHRLTVMAVRETIQGGFEVPSAFRKADLRRLDAAYEAHIRANNAWTLSNTDETMINLIGSWAKLTRTMMEMDLKWGKK